MTIIFYVIMLFCIVRTVQEVIAKNYKKAGFCLIGTLFVYVAANGGVYKAVNQLRFLVGETVFNIIFCVSLVLFTIFVSVSFWQYIKELSKKT